MQWMQKRKLTFHFVTFNPYTKKWVYLITLFSVYLTTVLTNQTLIILIIKSKNKDHATKWLVCDYIGVATRSLFTLRNNPYMFRFWFLQYIYIVVEVSFSFYLVHWALLYVLRWNVCHFLFLYSFILIFLWVF